MISSVRRGSKGLVSSGDGACGFQGRQKSVILTITVAVGKALLIDLRIMCAPYMRPSDLVPSAPRKGDTEANGFDSVLTARSRKGIVPMTQNLISLRRIFVTLQGWSQAPRVIITRCGG